MKRRNKLVIGLALVLSLTASAGVMIATTDEVATAAAQETTSSVSSATSDTGSTDVSSSDAEGAYADGVVEIVLGDTIAVSNEGATVDGSTVNITAAGVYSISGTLADGQINVDAKGKVYLEFDGVDVTSSSGPALMIADAKKVTLTLVGGTTNSLTDSAGDSEYDAALFTNDTLIINGAGTLIVNGNNNEGISSDDDLIINAGTVQVTAVDDGLNAHDDITITGGDVYILAGGDGLDSNGTINISGGTLVSLGSTAGGDGGLDAIGALTITGGTVIAGGNSIAAPSSDSTQASIYVSTGSTQPAGTVVTVTRDGEEILTYKADKEFQNLLVSSNDLIMDVTYDVYVGTNDTAISVTGAAAPGGAVAIEAPGAVGGAGAQTVAQS
jgi:hypothetical protein